MAKITYPNKSPGDQHFATEMNEVKASVNALYDGEAQQLIAPTINSAVAGDTQVTLNFTNPNSFVEDDNIIQYKLDTEPTTWTNGVVLAQGVETGIQTGLTNGLLYDFRIVAEGSGIYSNSDPSNEVSATPAIVLTDKSLDLVGGETKYISLPDVAALDFIGSAFTIAAWIKVKTAVPANVFIALKRVNDSFIDYNFSLNQSGKLNLAIYNDDSTTNTKSALSDSVEITADTWYLVTATFDGVLTASAAGINLYKNNAAVAFTMTNDALLTKSNDGIVDLGFNDATGSTTQNLRMAQISFWDKEFSLSEVQELYNSGTTLDLTTHSAVANLVAGYELDGDALDVSGNNYDGTEVNAPAYSTDEP